MNIDTPPLALPSLSMRSLRPVQGVTHVAFSDESHWNAGRYRSIGLITLRLETLGDVTQGLENVLKESGANEFKWYKLHGARERFLALKMCDFAVELACQGRLRVDVLTWDIEDSRHKISGRDDVANLQRMYYHLLRDVFRKHWPDGSIWSLYPDELDMDWENLEDYLYRTGLESPNLGAPGLTFAELFKNEFDIREIRPVKSSDYPLVQLADLFAGLGVFSREHFDRFISWEREGSPQLPLFGEEEPIKTSNSDRERFTVLAKFENLCKARKLGVSLRTNKRLETFRPAYPINFWPYKPQTSLDKAPTKG